MGKMESKPTYLSRILTEYRKANGFKQELVAQRIGITRSAYAYYESGKSEPNTATLRTLAKLYGAPIEDFFPPENDSLSFWDSGTSRNNSLSSTPAYVGKLTEDERKLIAIFRTTSPEHQKEIIEEIEKNIAAEEENTP